MSRPDPDSDRAGEGDLGERIVFVVGARRSGTHWLQRMLVAHPRVASVPSETHLISHGIAPLLERFHHGAPSSEQVGAIFIERARLLDAVRAFCDTALGAYLGDAARLVERTPLHVLHLPLIAEIYSSARVIHIIRDGAAVAASVMRQPWRPESIAEAAAEWRECVSGGRGAGLPPDRYREIRYEKLAAEPEEEITRLLEWLGVEVDAASLEPVLAQAPVERNLGPDRARSELTPEERKAVTAEAGALLGELGYKQEVRRRSSPRRRDPARAARIGPQHAQAACDQLVESLRESDRAALVNLLAPGAMIEVVHGPQQQLQMRGVPGAEAALDAARDDPALHGEPEPGACYPGVPWAAALLVARGDRGIASSLIAVRVGPAGVEELSYRLLAPER